ncbi:MAG: Gfo/Idh/MocA family oxidoreductase [Candidatus Sumerlaeia bacterium]|nr:Gfo/Idh/MocA family oxidoreductase [Candidatus Sumerlaeia bacterium]
MGRKNTVSRRAFLQRSAAVLSAPAIIPASALGRAAKAAPSDRITIGFIGTGDHGINRNLKRFLVEPDAMAVAVCDVDTERREKAREMVEQHYAKELAKGAWKGCASYNDFREIIERKDIDAVMISTPDHWHVIPAVMAVRAGKDVECEKPLSLTVHEGRVLADAVAKHNRIFQTSSENRSYECYYRAAELVRNGRIGKLRHIQVTLPRGHSVRPASMDVCDPPKGFDYNLWLGQAPEAPYCPARCHWNFRWILDYSGGQLTDWGAHLIDIAQWGNDTELTGPVEVEGTAVFPKEGLYNTATDFDIHYKYANGVTLTVSASKPGIRFEGTDGWVGNSGWNQPLEAEPKSILDSKIEPNEIHLYKEPLGEQRNFLDCVKSRKPCYAPAEVGHRTITIAHIGHIAITLKRKLRWDPEKEQFIGDNEANAMLRRPMREPWTL